MWKRSKKIFINNVEAHLVSKEMTRDELLEVMKKTKEVHVTTFSDGRIIGVCNACNTNVHIVIQDEFVWYICSSCNSVSFNSVMNLYRDIDIAQEFGGKLEQEIYYFRDLPKSLKIPNIH